jgi:hypothetical protein
MKTDVQNQILVFCRRRPRKYLSYTMLRVVGCLNLNYFYIDMDLCDLNLNNYIHGNRGRQEDIQPFNNVRNTIYVSREETVHHWLNCAQCMAHNDSLFQWVGIYPHSWPSV